MADMFQQPTDPDIVTVEPTEVVLVRDRVPMGSLRDFFDRSFAALGEAAEQGRLRFAGPPVGVYHGLPDETVDVGVGFPTAGPVDLGEDLVVETLPGGRALQIVHLGSYDTLQETYARVMAWVAEQGLEPGPVMWETYLTEPTPDGDPADMRTMITWPLAG
jgi:effector-binding domain-containing protein